MHLKKEDRATIESSLNNGVTLKQIGIIINKNRSTISREIKNHYITKNTGSVGRKFNNCLYRRTCHNRGKNCNINNCINFVEEKYDLLNKPPYVCNGCKSKNICTLSKHFYDSNYAHDEYKENLIESRSGIVIDQNEIDYLNNLLTPLVKNQGQSIHHVIINNKNHIMHSESKIYKLVDLGLLEIRNIDLPRKVRYRNRQKKTTIYKIDKHCLENRTYEDYQKYI